MCNESENVDFYQEIEGGKVCVNIGKEKVVINAEKIIIENKVNLANEKDKSFDRLGDKELECVFVATVGKTELTVSPGSVTAKV